MIRTLLHIEAIGYMISFIRGNLIILESSDMEIDRKKYIEEVSEEYGYDISIEDFKEVDWCWADAVVYRDLNNKCCKVLWSHKYSIDFQLRAIEKFALEYDPLNIIEDRFEILDL